MIMDIREILNSPIEQVVFEGREIFVKRDDLLSEEFSGNKARKFYYFLKSDFPNVKKIVSYGSNQSNAMYSLSVLAKMQGWGFEYYVHHLPSYLKAHPQGNYKYALRNGMRMIVSPNRPKRETFDPEEVLFIDEGGHVAEAKVGIGILGKEIAQWQKEEEIGNFSIFLPSGTGTTALFLQQSLPDVQVYTVPCVGDGDYLKAQFDELDADRTMHPIILEPKKKYHFGKLYRESYNIWLKLQAQTGIEFDLLYDPVGWMTMMENSAIFSSPLLYIHQGGLIGNESMLVRYQRKYGENIT